MYSERKKLMICSICNILIALMVIGAWVFMMSNRGGLLSSTGLSSLKYFTTLSNLFVAVVSVVISVRLLMRLNGKSVTISRTLFMFKYMAVSAVGVTFVVVIVMLAPFLGLAALYKGANLWFHLIVPVFSAAEFVAFENFCHIRLRDAVLCGMPPLVYGLVYIINILINGVGEWPNANDLYGFARWGIPIGIAIFAVIVLIGIACGLLLRLRCRKPDQPYLE